MQTRSDVFKTNEIMVAMLEPTIKELKKSDLFIDGIIQIKPSSYYENLTEYERLALYHIAVEIGVYCLPTTELIEHLSNIIGNHKAIEICGGQGVIGHTLGIPTSDARVKEDEWYKEYINNSTASRYTDGFIYPSYVEKLKGNSAVLKYKPKYVISSWAIFRDKSIKMSDICNVRSTRGYGVPWGIDVKEILKTSTFIHIGNESVHKVHKDLKRLKQKKSYYPWIWDRRRLREPESKGFITIFKGK